MKRLRSVLPLLLVLVVTWPSTGLAQTQDTVEVSCESGTGLTIEFDERANYTSTRDLSYLNLADCTGNETWEFAFTITDPTDARLTLYTGSGCTTDQESLDNCDEVRVIDSDPDSTRTIFSVTASEMAPEGCEGENSVTIWFLMFSGESSQLDDLISYCSFTLDYDMVAPEAPTMESATGSDQGAHLAWEPASTDDDDNDKTIIYCSSSSGSGADGDADADADGSAGCAAAEVLAAGQTYEELESYVCHETSEPSTRDTRVSDLTNNDEYAFAVAVVDRAGNVSLSSAPICATPMPVDDFYSQYREAGGQSGFCYVATVAYGGDSDHPDVRQLRWFRDRVLRNLPWGTWLIGQYYEYGPGLAATLAPHPLARRIVRGVLSISAGALGVGKAGGAWIPVVLALAILGACLCRRGRSRRGKSGGNGDS